MVSDIRLLFADCQVPHYSLRAWLNEGELRSRGLPVVADGYIEYSLGEAVFTAFIEADRGTEGLKRWQAKVRAYLELAFSGTYERLFGHSFFRVLVVTPSTQRTQKIGNEIRRLTDRIFWLVALPELRSHGPFVDIWQRPTGTIKHSLRET